MLDELQLFSQGPMSLSSLLLSLGVGAGLAALLSWHFRRFASTLSNREDFAQVFPFIILTTVLIISVVKSSLALSLGLVGALSIVRFRTPIKEPEELAYLFIAIAMGLGLGADQILNTVVSTTLILGIVSGFHWSRRGRENKNLYLSIDWHSGSEGPDEQLSLLNEILASHAAETDLRRFDVRENSAEATYFVDLNGSGDISALVGELRSRFPGIGVTFIDQSRMPSI